MNKLLKFVLSSFSLINIVLSNICFTPQDVQNKGLVSYGNKVYDIENYIHPAGQDTLLLAKGKSLEEFFIIPEYKFHINSRAVKTDLESIYIGDLYQSCGYNNYTGNYTQNYTRNYTGNYNKENNQNYILNNPSIYFPIISMSSFIFIVISTIIINNTTGIFFGKIINLYCFYPTLGEITFIFFYLSWWLTLFLLSLASEYLFTALGIWICLNLAFTLLPMTRNSIWIKFLNCPYNSLMFVHKIIALLSSLSVIVKIILIIIVYNFNFLFNRFSALMGTISSISILLTTILAFPLIRKHIFELFYYSHRILCIVTVITMSLHYITCLYYILPSFFLYIVDMILRIIYIKKIIYAKIQTYDLAYNTKYSILTLKLEEKINIKPGSYFFICCKNISKTQWHPISLMNIRNKGLNFCIKDMGENSWSNKLINYNKNNEDLDVLLQGPYMHFNLNYNYKYILCVSTGIGITPFFSILDDIKKNKPKILNKVIFIWIIPHESFIKPFLNIFDIIDTDLVIIDIYVTKSNNNRILDDKYYSLLNIYNKKPNIEDCINDFITNNFIKNTKEIGIFSCGSTSLTKDLCKICCKFDIDLFNENFT